MEVLQTASRMCGRVGIGLNPNKNKDFLARQIVDKTVDNSWCPQNWS